MAAKTRRRFEDKTNVFWTKDPEVSDNQIVKVHIPGVSLDAALNIKQPMVKKPVKHRKPRIATLQQASGMSSNCLTSRGGVGMIRRKVNHEIDTIPTREDPTASGNVAQKKTSLKDLGPEDKKRVANLVKELAKVGEEREIALTQLTQERIAFEERLQILQEEYDSNIKEKLNLQSRFLELQGLLKKYNKHGTDKNKDTSSSGNISRTNHMTQTSPGLIPSPEDVPGNVRQSAGQTKSPCKTIKQSGLEDGSHNLIADSGCQFPSPTKMSRQSTPLPGKPEGDRSLVLPGNGIAGSEKGSASNNKGIVENDSVVTGNGTSSFDRSRSKRESAQSSKILPGKVTTGVPQIASHQEAAGLDLRQGSLSVPGSSAGNHVTRPAVLTEIPTSQQEVAHSVPGKAGNGALDQEIGNNLPSYHFLGNAPPSLRSQWPPVYRHPPPVSSEHDPPVYANRMFDVSVTRPDVLRQATVTTNRSQSDTSQSFSAELDAVYRLYCREYELQLQLQQQQLELQKQQLQLQQQLQQLEYFQQRQQQQRPTSSIEEMPKSSSKTVIRETPDPTPAPQPEAQPQWASSMSNLVPTPDETYESHRGQSSVSYHQDNEYRGDEDEGTEGDKDSRTIRRITSSKRPKANSSRERNVQSHEGSYTSTNHNRVSRSRDNPSMSHHSLQPSGERGFDESSRGVNKEIIKPEEASHFRFSLHSSSSLHPSQTQSIPHSTRLENQVDWTNATDFEFRQLQESKIREHYGLGQRSVHSTQVLLDPSEPRVTGARYNLYESATVAEPVGSITNKDHQVLQGYTGSSIDRHPHGTRTDRQYLAQQNRFDATAPDDISERELEQRTLQNFSLYENRANQFKGASCGAGFYGDNNHGDHHEDIEPWVSESSGFQRDASRSLELNYPPQIIDLVEELEDEPTIPPYSSKPNYTVYLSPPRQETAAQNGGLDSTDSGFSNLSREKSPMIYSHQGSENEADIEELSVLEDIFFI
ncbi:uncharacterized protein LOC116307014 [Actinia tenebrosa]|uniref:Uncharacterized protein LOC116307014 n=1 Tax=Actinia tenebrosa TaxID=6105 RepID=A0A6P8J0K4_ACTTE|nr:uncharacterized protein LOC116307014 [Actinia tenebrosa]